MYQYEPTVFVEPLGYQPVEFLDIPPMHETPGEWTARPRSVTSGAATERERCLA
jgi:hypothetical protein